MSMTNALRGPVGRSFCASLADVDFETFWLAREAGLQAGQIAEAIRIALLDAVTRVDALSDSEIAERLGFHVEEFAFGQGRFWRAIDSALLQCQDELSPIADNLTKRTGLKWWSEQFAPKQQVELTGQATSRTKNDINMTYEKDESKSRWWVTPDGALITVNAAATLGGNLTLGDDYSSDRSTRPTSVVGSPTVYDVFCADDWIGLTEAYPSEISHLKLYDWAHPESPELKLPDWFAVAADWDAVHLSVMGYLSTAYQSLNLRSGGFTVLTGWHPSATVWLNPDALG